MLLFYVHTTKRIRHDFVLKSSVSSPNPGSKSVLDMMLVVANLSSYGGRINRFDDGGGKDNQFAFGGDFGDKNIYGFGDWLRKAKSAVTNTIDSGLDWLRNKSGSSDFSGMAEGARIGAMVGKIANEEARKKKTLEYKANKMPYIGSDAETAREKQIETRQKYFNLDKEFADSVASIARRYELRPEVLASRIAEEGVIDEAINRYNASNGNIEKLISVEETPTIGALWGLDDLATDMNKGRVRFTTPAPYEVSDTAFVNSHGRTVHSYNSPQWWFGIEATAAELKARRDKLKVENPKMSERDLDAAAAMSFNYGEAGVQKHIDAGKSIDQKFYPYIKVTKPISEVKNDNVTKHRALPMDLQRNRQFFK